MAKTTSDLSRSILLEGVPIAFIAEAWWDPTANTGAGGVKIESIDPADTVTSGKYRFLFDNLNQIAYKINRAGSSSGTATQFEISLSDNKKVTFAKSEKTIDGTTELEVSAAGGTSGSGLAEVTLTLNGADFDSSNYTSFEKTLNASESSYFLIAFPNGFTYDSKGKGKPDGWCYMFGKRTSNIEKTQGNAPTTAALTFSAELVPGTWTDFNTAATGWDRGLGMLLKPEALGVKVVPPAIESGDIATLTAGKMLIKAETISYT